MSHDSTEDDFVPDDEGTADEQARVDETLRSLRDDPASADTMARMRAGLAERIHAPASADEVPAGGFSGAAGVRDRTRHPLWRRNAAPFWVAAAAGLAALFYFASPDEGPSQAVSPPAQVALERGSPALTAEMELAAASDEDLAIALSYDVLTDLDVIEQLELLELLDTMEADGHI